MPNESAQVATSGKPEQGPFYDLDAVSLPAAGAYTAQGFSKLPPEARRLSVIASYTGGSASGQAAFRLQWQVAAGSPERQVTPVAETVVDSTVATKTGNVMAIPEYQLQVNGPANGTAGPIHFRLLSVEVPVGAVGARVLAAEIGDTANPGTASTRLYTSNRV